MRRIFGFALLVLAACDTGPKKEPPAPVASATTSALHLGAPIEASTPTVALADVAKSPATYTDKELVTTGTVTAVCQHMGCWMEIKDDNSEAHIKMAGHSFFVPKTASGHKARVMAKLVSAPSDGACEGEGQGMAAAGEKGQGCRAEAEQQLGRPLAKLELVADGVELM